MPDAAVRPDRPPSRRPLDPVWVTPVLFLVVGIGFAVPPVVNTFRHPAAANRNKDYNLWYQVGEAVRAGEPLYQLGPMNEIRYMYPPTLAVLVFAPLTHLGWTGFVAALAGAAVLTWIGCVYLATVLVAGRWGGLPRTLYWLPGAAAWPYVWDIFLLGQVNLFLLLLMLGAFLALRHDRNWLAGGLLGLAAAIKVFPLSAVVYFAFRRRWVAVVSTAVTCVVVLAVLPGPSRGFARNWHELGELYRAMAGDQSGSTMAARSSTGFTRRNQSLVSVSHRLLRPVHAGEGGTGPLFVNVADVSPRAAQLAGFAACFALGGVLLWATRLRLGGSPDAEGLEAGMVCLLAVLSSPLAWTYFFCWLLPAWAAAIHFILSDRWPARPRLAALAAVGTAGLLLASALSELIDPLLQAYGVTAWGAVLLFLTLAGMRRYVGRPAAVVASEPVSVRRAA